jgi:hydrogenase small subunit
MAEASAEAPYGRKTQRPPAVKESHVLWITARLSCDGDSVSVTAASQPSFEDIVMGAISSLDTRACGPIDPRMPHLPPA